MKTDLQHDATRHALGRVTPVARLELTGAVAADVSFCIDHDAEVTGGNLITDPAKMPLPPALIADAQGYAFILADRGDRAGLTDRVSDGFVQENMLTGFRGRRRGFQVYVVWRGVNDWRQYSRRDTGAFYCDLRPCGGIRVRQCALAGWRFVGDVVYYVGCRL